MKRGPIPFGTRQEAEVYVAGQLAHLDVAHEPGSLEWTIEIEKLTDYHLSLDDQLHRFTVTYGHTDAGILTRQRLALNAVLIPVEGLRLWALSEFIDDIVRTKPPNRWGLT